MVKGDSECKIKEYQNFRPKKHYQKNHAIIITIQWTYGLFGEDYRVATLSIVYLTVSGIIMPSLNWIGQFYHA